MGGVAVKLEAGGRGTMALYPVFSMNSFTDQIEHALTFQDFHAVLELLERPELRRAIAAPTGGRQRHFVALLLDAPNMAAVHDHDDQEAGFAALSLWLRLSPPDAPALDGLLEEAESFLTQETSRAGRLEPSAARGLHRFFSELTEHGFDPDDPSEAFGRCLAFADAGEWLALRRAQAIGGALPSASAGTARARL